jgi:catechol 2,3-dioxygenase-like lactoylglutathione lyase family enzyme
MSRLQPSLNISDLDTAVAFYTRLFGTPPARLRPGYANLAVQDPPLKLVLNAPGNGLAGTINHLGVVTCPDLDRAGGRPGLPGGVGDHPRRRRDDLDRPEPHRQEAGRLIRPAAAGPASGPSARNPFHLSVEARAALDPRPPWSLTGSGGRPVTAMQPALRVSPGPRPVSMSAGSWVWLAGGAAACQMLEILGHNAGLPARPGLFLRPGRLPGRRRIPWT